MLIVADLVSLSLFILMDFPMHVNRIIMELPICDFTGHN